MNTGYAAVLGAALLAVTGCGSSTSETDLGPGVDPAGSGARVVVHTKILPGSHGERFTEGAVPEIRLVGRGGRVHRPVHDHRSTATFAGLSPGTYRVLAAVRPCDANCGTLDRPMMRCTARVRVETSTVLEVRWRTGRPCHVTPA